MRIRKLGMLVSIGALAIAVPAMAAPVHPPHPTHPTHPADPTHPTHPAGSHKCTAHAVAYVASGTFVSWTATANADGTYTGTITVAVTHANHHAKSASGTNVTYTLTSAKVRFGAGANPPVAGDRVKVIGEITTLAKKCDQSAFTPTITTRKVDVKTATS